MGVSGLYTQILKVSKLHEVKENDKNITLAVDGLSLVYYFHNQNPTCLGSYTTLLPYVEQFLDDCKKGNITLHVFFDGISSTFKNKTLKKRKRDRSKKYSQLEDWTKTGEKYPNNIPVPPLLVRMIIQILDNRGIKMYGCKGEADNTLAFIESSDTNPHGFVERLDGILTNDSDIILNHLGKDIFLINTISRPNNPTDSNPNKILLTIKKANYHDLLQKFEIDYNTLLLSCLYLGTDMVKLDHNKYNIKSAIKYSIKQVKSVPSIKPSKQSKKKTKKKYNNKVKKYLERLGNQKPVVKETLDQYRGKYSELEYFMTKNSNSWKDVIGFYHFSDKIASLSKSKNLNKKNSIPTFFNAARVITKVYANEIDKENVLEEYNKIEEIIGSNVKEKEDINASSIRMITSQYIREFYGEKFDEETLSLLNNHINYVESEPEFPISYKLFEKAISYQRLIEDILNYLELKYNKKITNLDFGLIFDEKKYWNAIKSMTSELAE